MYILRGFLVLRELRAFDLTRVHVMSLIVLMDSDNEVFYIRSMLACIYSQKVFCVSPLANDLKGCELLNLPTPWREYPFWRF